MKKKLVVHTGIRPGADVYEESKVLAVPGVEFVLRGECRTPEQVLEAVREAHAALCIREPYTREVFAGASQLQVVVRYGIGLDTVDVDAATDFGVIVAHFPDYCVREVANHALALMLTCARKVIQFDNKLRTEGWHAARSVRSPMGTIHGETLGLIAFGNIARALAQRGQSLEMQIVSYDPFVEPRIFEEAGVESVSLGELAERSDYVSCHLPLTAETRGMLDKAFFDRMKPTAYFINTSRGAVVKEPDLIAALRSQSIAGAGLDVFESEPIDPHHPICSVDNAVLTPHLASFADKTKASRDRRVAQAALAALRGDLPEFVANPAVLTKRRK